MRKIKLFLSLVSAAILSLVITACAGENNGQQVIQDFDDGRKNEPEDSVIMPFKDDGDDDGQAERDRQDQEDARNHPGDDDRIGPIDNDDDGQAERDRQDQENLERENREREKQEQEQQGSYRHEVGGATFYTKHDLAKYIEEDVEYPGFFNLNTNAMVTDIWCTNGGEVMENKVGYSYSNGNDVTKGLWIDVPDSENKRLYHMITVWAKVDGVEYTTSIRMYDCSGPKTDIYCIFSDYMDGIHKDMAPLLLYALEQMEENPRNGALNDLGLNDNFYCN